MRRLVNPEASPATVNEKAGLGIAGWGRLRSELAWHRDKPQLGLEEGSGAPPRLERELGFGAHLLGPSREDILLTYKVFLSGGQ